MAHGIPRSDHGDGALSARHRGDIFAADAPPPRPSVRLCARRREQPARELHHRGARLCHRARPGAASVCPRPWGALAVRRVRCDLALRTAGRVVSNLLEGAVGHSHPFGGRQRRSQCGGRQRGGGSLHHLLVRDGLVGEVEAGVGPVSIVSRRRAAPRMRRRSTGRGRRPSRRGRRRRSAEGGRSGRRASGVIELAGIVVEALER